MSDVKKTAIIYGRVSSVQQAENELPIESQMDAGRREAETLDAVVVREFVDAGISARTDDRPAFLDAVSYCELNKVDFFITWHTDRFARNRIDAPKYKLKLRKFGTQIVYVSMKIDSSTKEGWLMEGMLELWDDYRSRAISDDTRRSMIKNAKDGRFNGGRVPFGFQVVKDGKRRRMEIIEHEATIVRRVFSMCVEGIGTRAIAIHLNEKGLLRRGHVWQKNTVSYLLRSWSYAGFTVFNRVAHQERTKNPEEKWIRTKSHDAIVDEDTFMKVQKLLNSRTVVTDQGHPDSRHLFTGMLKCGGCGRSMKIETATGRSKVYSYYNCASHITGSGCVSRRIPADELDQWLADVIVTRIMSLNNLRLISGEVHRDALEWAKRREAERVSMVTNLRDVEQRRRKLYDLMETGSKESLNLADIKPRLMELNAQALVIERNLNNLENSVPPEVTVTDADLLQIQAFVREVVSAPTNHKKVREFFAGFVSSIVMQPTSAEIKYRKDKLVTINATEMVHSERNWLPDTAELRTISVVIHLPDRFRKAA